MQEITYDVFEKVLELPSHEDIQVTITVDDHTFTLKDSDCVIIVLNETTEGYDTFLGEQHSYGADESDDWSIEQLCSWFIEKIDERDTPVFLVMDNGSWEYQIAEVQFDEDESILNFILET